jgi:hypothetical protein
MKGITMNEDNETFALGGVITLICVAVLLALSGCATKAESPAPVSHHEAAATAAGNCANAIRDIATSVSGDAASKVAAVGAIERLCQGGGNMQVAQRAPEPSLGQSLWQAALSVADIGARWYGIKAQRDVGITQSNNSAATAIASYGAFSGIASSGFAANAAIAGNIQAPAPNVTNTTVLSGTGVIGGGSYVGPVNTTTNPAPVICFPATATSAGTCSR